MLTMRHEKDMATPRARLRKPHDPRWGRSLSPASHVSTSLSSKSDSGALTRTKAMWHRIQQLRPTRSLKSLTPSKQHISKPFDLKHLNHVGAGERALTLLEVLNEPATPTTSVRSKAQTPNETERVRYHASEADLRRLRRSCVAGMSTPNLIGVPENEWVPVKLATPIEESDESESAVQDESESASYSEAASSEVIVDRDPQPCLESLEQRIDNQINLRFNSLGTSGLAMHPLVWHMTPSMNGH